MDTDTTIPMVLTCICTTITRFHLQVIQSIMKQVMVTILTLFIRSTETERMDIKTGIITITTSKVSHTSSGIIHLVMEEISMAGYKPISKTSKMKPIINLFTRIPTRVTTV